jgi:hypothetical protein
LRLWFTLAEVPLGDATACITTAASHTRFELGPALIQGYIPTGNFGATSASGNLFSGALFEGELAIGCWNQDFANK